MLLDSLQTMSIIVHMETTKRLRPILKWAGGKQALAATLIQYFPKGIRTYYEPFLGGGSVLLALEPSRAVAADSNRWLIDTYRAVRDDWNRVAQILERLPNTKADFLRIRRMSPQRLEPFQQAAHLIYLNKTCFRGLYRVNRQGQFNVPYGAYQRRYFDPDELRMLSEFLKKVDLRRCDFDVSLHDVAKGDFVYLDPPYFKLGGYADFNRYTPDQFRARDHLRLAALCHELDQRGVRWALSNSNTEFVRSLFVGFHFERIASRREINLNSKNRSIDELLIMNY